MRISRRGGDRRGNPADMEESRRVAPPSAPPPPYVPLFYYPFSLNKYIVGNEDGYTKTMTFLINLIKDFKARFQSGGCLGRDSSLVVLQSPELGG